MGVSREVIDLHFVIKRKWKIRASCRNINKIFQAQGSLCPSQHLQTQRTPFAADRKIKVTFKKKKNRI